MRRGRKAGRDYTKKERERIRRERQRRITEERSKVW